VFVRRSYRYRLDRAFAAFFRRVKAGDKPGYPRFRSHRRFNTARGLGCSLQAQTVGAEVRAVA